MTLHLGDVPAGTTLYVPFTTYDKTNGASVTMTGLAVTDIEIYKNGSTTQRASDAGYALLDTDGIDFDGITGLHGFSIDLNDNTDAGFFAVGSFYWIVVSTITIDSQTVTFIPATFRIRAAEATAGFVKATCQETIEANHLDHLLAVDYDPASKPGAATALLNELIESDAGVSRYTANALEQGPVGAGTSTLSKQDVADAVYDEAKGAHAGFVTTLALEASITTITNRIGAWTGSGVNTMLGAFKALLSKAASAPSDIGGTFDPAADSTEAISEAIAASGSYTVQDIVDGVFDEAKGAHIGHLADLAVPGDLMQLTIETFNALTTGIVGAGGDTLETLSDQIDALATTGAGAGSSTLVYTVTDEQTGLPVADVKVWATTDVPGANVVAGGRTSTLGVVTLYVDPGTYYIWRRKAGYTFENPDTEVVT